MEQNVLQKLLDNTFIELPATLSDVAKATNIHTKRLKIIFENPEAMTRTECKKLEEFFELEEGALYVGTVVDVKRLVKQKQEGNGGVECQQKN